MFRHEDFVKVQQVVNVFDVKETEINLTEFKKKVHEEHINDVERVKNYKVYYERVYAETGARPSKFQPEEGYALQKYKVKGVDIELLSPGRKTKRVICFFKGCGFSNYMTDAANREMQHVIKLFDDMSVISINYRIAPEHSYEEMLEDTVNGFLWMLEQGYQPEDITFIGDSSGGGTSIATTMMLRDKKLPMPGRLVLFSPWANVAMDTPSYTEYKDERDCMLGTVGLMEFCSECFLIPEDPHNPYVSVCYGSFADMPKTLIQLGTEERVRDDAIMIAEKMLQCKREITVEVYENMFHEFQFYTELEAAKKAWNQVVDFINYK